MIARILVLFFLAGCGPVVHEARGPIGLGWLYVECAGAADCDKWTIRQCPNGYQVVAREVGKDRATKPGGDIIIECR